MAGRANRAASAVPNTTFSACRRDAGRARLRARSSMKALIPLSLRLMQCQSVTRAAAIMHFGCLLTSTNITIYRRISNSAVAICFRSLLLACFFVPSTETCSSKVFHPSQPWTGSVYSFVARICGTTRVIAHMACTFHMPERAIWTFPKADRVHSRRAGGKCRFCNNLGYWWTASY